MRDGWGYLIAVNKKTNAYQLSDAFESNEQNSTRHYEGIEGNRLFSKHCRTLSDCNGRFEFSQETRLAEQYAASPQLQEM